MKRKQFTFYRSFFNAMSEMDLEERGVAISWVCAYALDGVEPPEMRGNQKIFRDLVRPVLESGRNKALAGRKGGSTTQASKQVSKKENEIEKEIEIEGECENDMQQGLPWTYTDSFERFWNLYPVKIGKEEAFAVWMRKRPDVEAVCKGLKAWICSRPWNQADTRFVPRAAKFLEQEYYLQAPEGPAPCGALGQLGAAEIEAIQKILEG